MNTLSKHQTTLQTLLQQPAPQDRESAKERYGQILRLTMEVLRLQQQGVSQETGVPIGSILKYHTPLDDAGIKPLADYVRGFGETLMQAAEEMERLAAQYPTLPEIEREQAPRAFRSSPPPVEPAAPEPSAARQRNLGEMDHTHPALANALRLNAAENWNRSLSAGGRRFSLSLHSADLSGMNLSSFNLVKCEADATTNLCGAVLFAPDIGERALNTRLKSIHHSVLGQWVACNPETYAALPEWAQVAIALHRHETGTRVKGHQPPGTGR